MFVFDNTLNVICSTRLKSLLRNLQPVNRYIAVNFINKKIEEFLRENTDQSLFKRNAEVFQWMVDFPWITGKKETGINLHKYHFSQFSKDFKQWFIKVTDDYDTIRGFLMLTLHKGILKTPYIITDDDLISDVAIFIIKLATHNKVSVIVSQHAQLVIHLKKMKKFFIHQRASEYGFITTKNIVDKLKNTTYNFYDGDGDGAFT